ncbi:MAG: 1-acyl-sn-glycerol-3-phosphate acyltransferase [Planctomycetota bacterium]|nr:1-acyl-sn-glycerol-3-phosphate acyltransferase [Planctomycetota bacterium]
MPRLARVLLTGLAFLVFALGAAAVAWSSSLRARRRPLARGAAPPQPPGAPRRLPRVRPPGRRPGPDRRPRGAASPPPGPFVLVANHPTLLDVVLLLAAYPDVTCVVKAAWFRNPVLGHLLRQAGYLPGPDAGEEEAAPVLERMVGALREGTPVLVFPEGTRSPPGGLRRFRVGALEAARRAGVPVVPVVIACSARTLLKGQPWYDVPGGTIGYELGVLGPVRLGPDDDPRQAARALRARYAERLGVLPEQPTLDAQSRHAVP